jgi:hypothetical protein
LALAVSHHNAAGSDWKLVVRADATNVFESEVSTKTAPKGWLEASVDLTPFAGKSVYVELLNVPTEWSNEFGYWGRAEVISE